MKHANYILIGLSAFAGCSDRDEIASRTPDIPPIVSTDLQDDLWHAHRHVHDDVQVHDHDHTPGFLGGHQHPHGHTHRHAETQMGGIVVSLQRRATPGQLPSESILIPPRLHLEILPGLPTELNVCLLSEASLLQPPQINELAQPSTETELAGRNTAQEPLLGAAPPDDGTDAWSYWSPDLKTITIKFQLEGTEYAIACKKHEKTLPDVKIGENHFFCAEISAPLRARLASTKARLRLAKFTVELGDSRLHVREQIYFQGEELSVFLR